MPFLSRPLRLFLAALAIVGGVWGAEALTTQQKAVLLSGGGPHFYVDSVAGSDSNAGNNPGAPWQTIAKVNATSFAPGSQILFKAGDSWREVLVAPSSGAPGKPIVFGKYGSGANPILMTSVTKSQTANWSPDDAALFVIDFETGNLSQTSGQTTTNGTVAVSAAAAYDASYGMRTTFAGTGAVANAYKTLTAPVSNITTTFWFRIGPTFTGYNAGNGGQLDIAAVYDAGFNTINNLSIQSNASGHFRLTGQYWYGSFTSAPLSVDLADTPTWYRVVWSYTNNSGVGNDSQTITLYNTAGTQLGTQTTTMASASHTIKYAYLGSIAPGFGGQITPANGKYIDYDDWIISSGLPAANVWFAYDTKFVNGVGSISHGSTPTVLTNSVTTKGALASQGDFYYTTAQSRVYVYSTSNPATAYSDGIECWWVPSPLGGIIQANGKNYINIQDIDLKFGGMNGLEIANSNHWTIQRSNASYLGGVYYLTLGRAGVGYQIDEGSDSITINHVNTAQIINNGIGVMNGSSNTGDTTNVSIGWATIDTSAQWGIEINNSSASHKIDGVTIANSTIKNSGTGVWGSILPGPAGNPGIKLYAGIAGASAITTNVAINQSEIYGSQGSGLELEENVGNVAVNYTSIHDNTGDGVTVSPFASTSLDFIAIDASLIYNNAGNGFAYNGGTYGNGYSIYNTTFYNNGLTANATHNVNIQALAAGKSRLFKNNIVYAVSSLAWNSPAIAAGANQDNNLFYIASGNMMKYGATSYTSAQWATYQSASGQDTHSVNADPLFTNRGSADFSLQTGSPAIDAGANLGAAYELGLAPGSTWPNGVSLLNQNDHGAGWEIGACIYP